MNPQSIRVLLLPGMDGTGQLLRRFLDALPGEVAPRVIRYPNDVPMSCSQLMERVWKEIPDEGSFAILGESYSGPVALRIAHRRPRGLRAVVLVVTFAEPPKDWRFALFALAGRPLFTLPPPAWLVRRYFLGPGASEELVRDFRQVVGSVPAEVLAGRLRDIMRVDVRRELERCAYPTLCLAAAQDRLIPAHSQQRMLEMQSGLELSWMQGPHGLLQREPEEAAARITVFLRRVFHEEEASKPRDG